MIRRAVSAALLLRDGFTGQAIRGAAGTLCTLDGQPFRGVWKNGGWLVLTDLAPGEHTLVIRHAGYLPETVLLTASAGVWREDIITLKPGAGYRFPGETVRVNLRVSDGGEPLSERELWLGIPQRARLKIAQDPGKEPEKTVRLFCQGNPEQLPVPGHFLAADAKNPERLFLRQLEGETGSLNAPMEKVHQRGVELIPVQRYLTDGEGMLRILLRSPGTLSAFCSGIWKTMEVTAGEQSLEWDLSNNN